MERRTFIKLGVGVIGAGVAVGYAYQNRFEIIAKVTTYLENKDFNPNAFVFVQPDGRVKLICHRSEMGQHVRTAIPMILAEELDVDWKQVDVIQGLADSKYGSQNTDGSKSVRDFYIPLRKAAASVRAMLVEAAARQWGVEASQCTTKGGKVLSPDGARSLGYGDLVHEASKLPVPKDVKLKDFSEFQFVGKPRDIVDAHAIVTGQAKFGADIEIPGMVVACLARSPVPKAKLKSVDDKAARATRDVIDVVQLEAQGPTVNTNASVAVIAKHTWAAIQGRNALQVEWDESGLKLDDSAAFKKELASVIANPKKSYLDRGSLKKGKGLKQVSREYHTPFLVHAPMEPLVSTADVKAESCEVWAPCQDPQRSQKSIAKFLGIDAKNVKFHVTFLGGGFGRKSQSDFVMESVMLSKKLGKPVKVQWTREDEIKHGFYHAEALQKFDSALDSKGKPVTWRHRSAFPTIMSVFMPSEKTPAPWELGMGATNFPYNIPNAKVETGPLQTSLRIGWLRSVCELWHAFGINSFVDELARNAKRDPVDYRLELIGRDRVLKDGTDYPQDLGRLKAVIHKTRDAFGWKDRKLAEGHGKGFANHYSFFSYVAVALEASVKDEEIRVHRADCTIDCGLAVNPQSVRAQMEGAIVFGLSAALYGKITTAKGRVVQSNFHDYPVLRMPAMPKVNVHIINGKTDAPTGVGEPGVPPIAPALASAIEDATGKRLRSLPLRLA